MFALLKIYAYFSVYSTVLRHTSWKKSALVAQLVFFPAMLQFFNQQFILSPDLHHVHGVIDHQILHLSFQLLQLKKRKRFNLSEKLNTFYLTENIVHPHHKRLS